MLLHRDGVVCASLDRGIVCDHHALHTVDSTNSCYDATCRHIIFPVHVIARHLAQFKEWCTRVNQCRNPVPDKHFASLYVLVPCLLWPTLRDLGVQIDQVFRCFIHLALVFLEVCIVRVDGCRNDGDGLCMM